MFSCEWIFSRNDAVHIVFQGLIRRPSIFTKKRFCTSWISVGWMRFKRIQGIFIEGRRRGGTRYKVRCRWRLFHHQSIVSMILVKRYSDGLGYFFVSFLSAVWARRSLHPSPVPLAPWLHRDPRYPALVQGPHLRRTPSLTRC